jgi:hypothetical protein
MRFIYIYTSIAHKTAVTTLIYKDVHRYIYTDIIEMIYLYTRSITAVYHTVHTLLFTHSSHIVSHLQLYLT